MPDGSTSISTWTGVLCDPPFTSYIGKARPSDDGLPSWCGAPHTRSGPAATERSCARSSAGQGHSSRTESAPPETSSRRQYDRGAQAVPCPLEAAPRFAAHAGRSNPGPICVSAHGPSHPTFRLLGLRLGDVSAGRHGPERPRGREHVRGKRASEDWQRPADAPRSSRNAATIIGHAPEPCAQVRILPRTLLIRPLTTASALVTGQRSVPRR